MYGVNRGSGFFVVLVTFMLAVCLASLPGIIAVITQRTYSLDLNSPLFNFENNAFNDSATTKEFDFSGVENRTYWIKIPKNSTIINASFNLSGKITTIYQQQIISHDVGLTGFSIGDVTSNPGNEIVTGRQTSGTDQSHLFVVKPNGTIVWNFNTTSPKTKATYSTSIGNVTNHPGNEIAFGSEDFNLYLIDATDSGGQIIWNYSAGVEVRAVKIADIDGDGINEVVGGAGTTVVVLNSAMGVVCSIGLGGDIRDIDVGNLTTGSGNEIAVVTASSGTSDELHILNSTCDKIIGVDTNATTTGVSIGDINDNPGNEVATTGGDSYARVYNITDSSAAQDWYFQAGAGINSIVIGDVALDIPGNETVIGTDTKKVITLDKNGNMIWSFGTLTYVHTVEKGNLTSDQGIELAAGDGSLYIFNFNYFPTNLSIDVGNSGPYDWSYPEEKLRTSVNAYGFNSAIENFLSTCTPDANGKCDVPFVFHSDWAGKLNISQINISYYYNTSFALSYQYVPAWSRTNNVKVNESVGNYSRNITFSDNPSDNINIYYIRINDTATECDFNGTSRNTTTVSGQNVCDVIDFTFPASGGVPFFSLLWDNNLSTGVPHILTESSTYFTNITDDFNLRKPVTITNQTPAQFTNIIANVSINYPVIDGVEFLNVTWNSVECDITPSSAVGNCDTSSPTYTAKVCNSDTFYVCKEDAVPDGVIDFFKWVQPYSNGQVNYEAGGSTNLNATLTNGNVTPASDLWGSYFNFSVDVTDTDGDLVNVNLWLYKNLSGQWSVIKSSNLTGTGKLWFNVSSDKSWVGSGEYKFQYQDLNGSFYPFHSYLNTSNLSGPVAEKHDSSVIYVQGNNSKVNRSGTETTRLVVLINDTDTGSAADSGITCRFWVTTDGSEWDSGHSNTTNSTGHCVYDFDPDSSYSVGNRSWKAGVVGDPYYNPSNSTTSNLTVKGMININFTQPAENGVLNRNISNTITARMLDEYDQYVQIAGYNCTFYHNGGYIGNSTTNSNGICSVNWNPSCTPVLGYQNINVTISGNVSDIYSIDDSNDYRNIIMKDTLVTTITNPSDMISVFKGTSLQFNSSVNDTCFKCSESDYNVTWNKKWKRELMIHVNETSGISRNNEPVIINGTTLENEMIDLNDWRIDYTTVLLNGQEIPFEVKAWTDANKDTINQTQEYFEQFTELVFLIDSAPFQNQTIWVYYNRSGGADYNLSYIPNSGFEGNSISGWDCTKSNCPGAYCLCQAQKEGTETTGNYSLHLASEANLPNNIVWFSQNLGTPLSSDYVKIRYKVVGEYTAGSYLNMTIGNVTISLNTSSKNVWQETNYQNTSFQNATTVNFSVHDIGDGGGFVNACHVYIDYLCISNSSSSCLTFDSGAGFPEKIESHTQMSTNKNMTWSIPLTEDMGLRRMIANSTGPYHQYGIGNVTVQVRGWSNLSDMDISSSYCWYDQDYLCMQNGTVDALCRIDDLNTSSGVYGYNVSYYFDGQYVGSNITNNSGVSSLSINIGDQIGKKTIICNATDDIFYNITQNSLSFSVNVTGGNTTASVILTPSYEQATGITKFANHSFVLNIIILNTGDGAMYSPSFDVSVPSGMYMNGFSCPPVAPYMNCTRTRTVNVTNMSSVGNSSIQINVSWSNADSTEGNETNQTIVNVIENPVLRIIENYKNHTIPRGYTQTVGNFTVESIGNTNLSNITIAEKGGQYQNLSQWFVYSTKNITSLSKGEAYMIFVNISVPPYASEGFYITNVTANATLTQCSPASACWDQMMLNISVILPDWQLNKNNVSKIIGTNTDNGTIGVITVTNNRNSNYSFTATLTGNGTGYMKISRPSFNLTGMESTQILVYHNSTTGQYNYGAWFGNLTINNTLSTFPNTVSIPVYLDVINLVVNIISPTESSKWGTINASDTVNITVNATNSGVMINQNMTWSVLIGGENCPVTNYTFDSPSSLWNVTCTAPVIQGNPINASLKVYGTYQGIEVYDQESGAVVYDDITPPNFSAVIAPNVLKGTTPYILIKVNITDNENVDDSWLSVSRPGGTDSITSYTVSGDEYTFNYTNPDIVGDYDITVYANDTRNQTGNTTGWFDVYRPIDFYGSFQDPDGKNQTINLTFYRDGTGYFMNSILTNSSFSKYNLTAHKRKYDIRAGVYGHTVRFSGVNTTQTAINQFGIPDPGNLTRPIRFDSFPNHSSPHISNINLPNTAENILMAFVVHAPNLSFDSAQITLRYTSALPGWSGEEGDLRLFVCGNWSYSLSTCDDGEFSHLNESILPNQTSDTFTFNTTSFSAFAIAKSCYPNVCGAGSPAPPPGGTTPSSGPGGTTTSRTECGNGICESGENSVNCPDDCLEKKAFTVTTGIREIRIHPGENSTYPFIITNNLGEPIDAIILQEGLGKYIRIEDNLLSIPSGQNGSTSVFVDIPKDTEAGTYTGSVTVTAGEETETIPVRLVITYPGKKVFTVDVSIITKAIEPGGKLIFNIEMRNLGTYDKMNMTMDYLVNDIRTKEILARMNESLMLEDILTLTRSMDLGDEIPPGEYILEVIATFGDKSVKDSESFQIAVSFWATPIGGIVPYAVSIAMLVLVAYFARGRYVKWRKSKIRYIFPLDKNKLPQESMDSFWVGKIAETENKTFIDPKDLMTHFLVAGATGAGKSVGASVIVEEALDKKIPVVVFDPTAQWTGFVKPCEDEFVLRRYQEFGMDPREKKSYKGMIYEIEDPHVKIDIRSYLNPGEITVFVMNKLKAGEYDISVKDIIDMIFSIKWEESTSLKMIIVFDEVHRLLEKYGGKGGYVSLERACREFRKWGIGVVMCSQVLTDFKEAIAGNVLTDIQLNTKAIEDITRVKDKYGEEYAQRISRQGIGVGMFQNPKYNEGKPYFVQFRPTFHNPHKISNEEMEMYKEFAIRIKAIRDKIAKMKKGGRDTSDVELDLKLANDKLKQGRFRMAKIYITSLEKLLGV
ncbi:MAG: DUF87 domain-containing protein [Candidatus Aenigmarchaeota archaeon]|nr:DUF87 domain-containing protein [Candidatus Aenigmarchaeota archaeon]